MTTNAEKDLVLVETLKNNEDRRTTEKALEALFGKYRPFLMYQYRSKVNSDEDAEDLVMEAFEKCLKNIGRYDSKSAAFSTWLFTLTRNLFIDSLRKKREETVAISDMAMMDSDGTYVEKEFEYSVLNPEEELIRNERDERVRDVVKKTLTGNLLVMREMVELKYFHNMSYEQIANITGKPLGTVKASLFRAKDILRKACEKEKITV